MIYDIDVDFSTSNISRDSLKALIRWIEAEYCQIALQIKMKEWNYAQLDLNGEQAEEDRKTMESLDRQVEAGKEAMELHLKNLKYFKNILEQYYDD